MIVLREVVPNVPRGFRSTTSWDRIRATRTTTGGRGRDIKVLGIRMDDDWQSQLKDRAVNIGAGAKIQRLTHGN